jgi:DNA-binding NarL/FixJ family response regulator
MYATDSPDVLVGPAVRVLMGRGLSVQASVAALFTAAEELEEEVGLLAALVVAYEQQRQALASASSVVAGVELDERESAVISGVAHGLSDQEIADHLYLGTDSIRTCLRASYRKLGVTSRTEAVLWGIDHGLGRTVPEQTIA